MSEQRYSRIGDLLFLSGKLGLKNLSGFYKYKINKGMKPVASVCKDVENIIKIENNRKRNENYNNDQNNSSGFFHQDSGYQV